MMVKYNTPMININKMSVNDVRLVKYPQAIFCLSC